MIRRAIAVGGGLVILLVLFLGIKGCLGAQKEQDFKDYAKTANLRVHDSNVTTKQFFTALTGSKSDSLDLQTKVNTSRVDAEQNVKLAKGLDHPDELSSTNNWLVQTLEFRSEAISKIADRLPSATGTDKAKSAQAIKQIAAEMQGFVASDVIYQLRARPDFASAFKSEGIDGTLISSQSPPSSNPDWMTPQFVADALGGSAGADDKAATPGLHGTALGAVTIGDTELVDGDVNQVSAAGASLDAEVENQGESDEANLPVTVVIKGAGSPITKTGTIPNVAQGETATVSIPLGEVPTDGTSTVDVSVAPVPGEGTKDNNKATYQVSFTK
jgi:hypothetical protein